MRAIVIGGGIGGLTTALSLLQEGIDVEVYEASDRLEAIGAGLQVSANAVRVLEELGVGARLEDIGVVSEGFWLRDLRTNDLLNFCPLGEPGAKRYGARLYQVHRADLQQILIEAVPDDIVQLDHRCTGFTEDDDGITAYFEGRESVTGDVLIGADGIHSVVRRQFLGVEDVEFGGIVALRALVPRERTTHLGLPLGCTGWLGRGRSAVAYWCRSGQLLNFVGVVPWDNEEAESWTTLGDIRALRASFADANEVLTGLLLEVDKVFITGYFVRDPLVRWVGGRAAILGDAAHPMHPFLAQGACQAIEDAFAIAQCLKRHGVATVPTALEEYQQRRHRRASDVQTASKTGEVVWNMSDPTELRIRNGQFKSIERLDPFAATVWSWVYEHDPVRAAREPLRRPAEEVLDRDEARSAWNMWNRMLTPDDTVKGRHGIRAAFARFHEENFRPLDGTLVEEVVADGVPCLVVRAREKPGGPVVLHFHGGGYMMGSARTSAALASRISAAMDATCAVVDYRLAPEFPYPAALHDCVTAYSWFVGSGVDPRHIVFVGEAAGAGVATATAMRVHGRGDAVPGAIIAMSPFVDLSVSGESIDAVGDLEPISRRKLLVQMAAAYLQGHDPEDPLVSPVFGNLHGLSPMLIQVAEKEALRSDAERLAERACEHGVTVELETYPDTVHLFSMFDFLPEAGAALSSAARFVDAHARISTPY